MRKRYILQLICFSLTGFSVLSCAQSYSGENNDSVNVAQKVNPVPSPFEERKPEFEKQKQQARTFLSKNKSYNQNLVFLIDMRIPSQNYRFFVVDLEKDSITEKGLVAHGAGSVSGDSLVFSNVPESYQSSLGKYKIGAKYAGNFGKSYKLHGLDKTNNNAYKRYIVLHPYSCVPDVEQEFPICESLGCAMVSDNFIKVLYPIIDNSKKPILMVMYY